MFQDVTKNHDNRIAKAVKTGDFITAVALYAQHCDEEARQGDEKTRYLNAMANVCAITIGVADGNRGFAYFGKQLNTGASSIRAIDIFMKLRSSIHFIAQHGESKIDLSMITGYCSKLRAAIPEIDRSTLAKMLSCENDSVPSTFFMDNIALLSASDS